MTEKLPSGALRLLWIFLALSLTACAGSNAGAVSAPAPVGMPATLEQRASPQAPASSPTETATPTETPRPTETARPFETPPPQKKLDWDEADAFAGQTATVCGQVMGAHFAKSSNGKPTFLNMGKDYPAPTRFVVLIWGDDREKFTPPPEEAFLQRVICVTGEITLYNSTAEMIVTDPTQIEILP